LICGHIEHNFQTRYTKDDCGQVWFKLAMWFQRRRFLKKLRTLDDDDDGCIVMAKAHVAF